MGKGILIGIDAGTTVFKAAAFNSTNANLLAVATRNLPVIRPHPGWAETPVAALDRALTATLRELRKALGPRWKHVHGVGLASQGGSSIFARRENGGALLSEMVLWHDARAILHAVSIRASRSERWWRQRLLSGWTPAGLARLAWFGQHRPGVFEDPDAIHVGAGEYLFHRMTGVWRQDAGNAFQVGSYNAATGVLTDEMLRLAGFSRERVAPLREGHETAPLDPKFACRNALEPGIPVAGPYIDQEAAWQSVERVSAKPLQCSLGTAWVGNFALPKEQVGSAGMQFVLRGAKKGKRIIVLPLLMGNTAWDWALEMFVSTNPQRAFALAKAMLTEQLLPPAGMVCVPFLLQANALHPERAGAGIFDGVGVTTSGADFVRALACGMCCELYRVFACVKEAKHVDSVIISGGASKGAYFRKLIATLFSPLPVYRQSNGDTAAARGALVALGKAFDTSPATRIVPATGTFKKRIRSAYDDYVDVFAIKYGNQPVSAPYSFPRDRA